MTTEKIKQFWDNQAKEFGASDLATAPDHAYRQLEIEAIMPHIKGPRVLDVGCGNGYSTLKFNEAYPDIRFTGIDYSGPMIEEALKQPVRADLPCAAFAVGDVRSISRDYAGQFDTIISERCLINLMTWEEQLHGLMEMKKCLAPKGRIILVENFVEGLANLNSLRAKFDLHEIKTRWHNRYLVNDEFVDAVNDHFTVEHYENIGNLYYIISRVVYAALAKQEGREPEYEHPINYIAAKLPSLGDYGFSPNMMYVMRAR